MNDRRTQQLVDSYVRGELSPEQEADFEARLMADVALQDELEAALAIKQALRGASTQRPDWVDSEDSGTDTLAASAPPEGAAPWIGYALAASVVAAVVCAGMLWRVHAEAVDLRERLQASQAPRTVLTVRVDIMRSGCDGAPGTIAQLPPGAGTVVLDIELSPAFRKQTSISYALSGSGSTRFAGRMSPNPDGRARLAFVSETLAADRWRLELHAAESHSAECRLIELRGP